jgi:hypothetical protein
MYIGAGQANIEFDAINPLKVKNTAASTSPTTGALTVAGGVGIAGAVRAGAELVSGSFGQFNGGVIAGYGGATGFYYFGNSGSKYLSYDGASFNFQGGQVNIATGSLWVGNSVAAAAIYFGNAGTKYLQYDGTNFYLQGGVLFQNHSLNLSDSSGATASNNGGCALSVSFAGGGAAYGIVMQSRTAGVTNYGQVFLNSAAQIAGSITFTDSAVAYNTFSDERAKEDLKSFDAGNIVDDTNVYDFAWKATGERSYGILAQQAVSVYPAAITHNKDADWWGVDYSKYVPVLLQELKALRARVAQLEGRLDLKPA